MIFSLIQFWSGECTSVLREREREGDRTVARWSQGLCATARESSEYSRGIQSKINKRQGRSNTNKKISKQMDCASKWNIETKQAANRCQPSTVNFKFDFRGYEFGFGFHILFAFHLRVVCSVSSPCPSPFLSLSLFFRFCSLISHFYPVPSIRIRNQSTIEIVAHFNCCQRFLAGFCFMFGLNLTLVTRFYLPSSLPPSLTGLFRWPNTSVKCLFDQLRRVALMCI